MSAVLNERPNFPDVIGDRKLLRFLRGHDHSVEKACEMATNFLVWRDENGVDEIRERIVHGGLDHPRKFPNGEKVLVMSLSRKDRYLSFDRYLL